jgi:hypothetical protein
VVALVCASSGFVLTVLLFALSRLAKAALAATLRRAAELEVGIAALANFETAEHGRALLQKVQREHPLLMRTSMGEESSLPPPTSSGIQFRK